MCVCVSTYIHTYILTYLHTYMHTYVYTYIHTHTHTHTHIYIQETLAYLEAFRALQKTVSNMKTRFLAS